MNKKEVLYVEKYKHITTITVNNYMIASWLL